MNRSVKHITTIIFCTIFVTNLTAQFNPLIAYTPATQVIYIGFDNPIAITLGEYNLRDVNIKVSEGSIRNADEDGKYLWKICSSKSDSVFLSIYCNKILVKKFKYETKELLYPTVRFDCCDILCGGVHLLTPRTNGLIAEFSDNMIMVAPSRVLSFHVEFYDSTHNVYKVLYNNGRVFTKAVKDELAKFGSNFNIGIGIYNIKVQVGCEEKPRIMPYSIKDMLRNN